MVVLTFMSIFIVFTVEANLNLQMIRSHHEVMKDLVRLSINPIQAGPFGVFVRPGGGSPLVSQEW